MGTVTVDSLQLYVNSCCNIYFYKKLCYTISICQKYAVEMHYCNA